MTEEERNSLIIEEYVNKSVPEHVFNERVQFEKDSVINQLKYLSNSFSEFTDFSRIDEVYSDLIEDIFKYVLFIRYKGFRVLKLENGLDYIPLIEIDTTFTYEGQKNKLVSARSM